MLLHYARYDRSITALCPQKKVAMCCVSCYMVISKTIPTQQLYS